MVFENFDEDVLGEKWVRTTLSSSSARSALSVTLVDLDSDGDVDIVAALDSLVNPVIWFEQEPISDELGASVLTNVQFSFPKLLPSGLSQAATGVVALDMDSDGDVDLVVYLYPFLCRPCTIIT